MDEVRSKDWDNGHRVTTSAHWGSLNDKTRTNNGDLFEYSGTHPIVWASLDHHANYYSMSDCDNAWSDQCNAGFLQLLGLAQSGSIAKRNVGNLTFPFDLDLTLGGPNDCTRSMADPALRTGVECYHAKWANPWPNGDSRTDITNFAGWSGLDSDRSTHYSTVLNYWGLLQ